MMLMLVFIAKKILGKAQKDENFVVISIGSGIGAGVYINWKSSKG